MKIAKAFFFLGLIVVAVLFFQSLDDPFFWDGVQLGAKHAWFYYENDFGYFWLPNEIDSGHPPFFGMYLAACWQLFGHSLLTSHLAMLPFISLFFITSWNLGRYYLGPSWGAILALLFMADPTVLSQLLLLGPDVALMAFFLLAFLGFSQKKGMMQAIGILGLGLLSMRGIMSAFALFLFDFFLHFRAKKVDWVWWKGAILMYGPGALVAVLFFIFHYLEKGWIGYHAESPWAISFKIVDASDLWRNVVILIWRLLDFGRVFLWGGLLIVLLSSKKIKEWPKISGLAILLLLVLGWPFIVYVGLSQHRYLIPFYLILHLMFLLKMIELDWKPRSKVILTILVLVGLMTGNLWVYSSDLSQGWDSSLAHKPYFELRDAAEGFLGNEGIPLGKVGTSFPAIGPLRNYDPQKNGVGFSSKSKEIFDYYFISNINGGFEDGELRVIRSTYNIIFEEEKRGVYVRIYEKKETEFNGLE